MTAPVRLLGDAMADARRANDALRQQMDELEDEAPLAEAHPAWCVHPHRVDEPHYGPCGDVDALNLDGDPVLVGLQDDGDGDQVFLLPQVPAWPYQPVDYLVFSVDQARSLRDTLNGILDAASPRHVAPHDR